MGDIRHYFAYGSNMNVARVETRGLSYLTATAATLPGYRLAFNKCSRQHAGFGHANIVFDRTGHVQGVVYEFAASAEILKMDPFEAAPRNYGRDVVRLDTVDGDIWAWTYFANPAVCRPGMRPPPDYLSHLLAGAEFLTPEYLQWLHDWGADARS